MEELNWNKYMFQKGQSGKEALSVTEMKGARRPKQRAAI